MNMFMLAELTSKWDFSGIWCLASIGFLIIALFAYSKGPWSGSCTCLFFFVIAVFATGDMGDIGSGSSVTPNSSYIANRSQTKIIERYKYSIDRFDCIFETPISRGFGEDTWFLPAEERVIKDGLWVLKSTGVPATVADFYIYNETYSPTNVSKKDGGWGVPEWIYHPASSIYVFGIIGLPSLLIVGYIKAVAGR